MEISSKLFNFEIRKSFDRSKLFAVKITENLVIYTPRSARRTPATQKSAKINFLFESSVSF